MSGSNTATSGTLVDPDLPEGWGYVISGPDKAKHVVKFDSPDANKPDVEVFKLTKDAYHAVWLYVMTGLMYPKTNERFAEIIPQANMKTLNDKDSHAWGDMRDAIVNIHGHCETFNNESMSSWTSMTNSVITYVRYALSNFNGPDNFTKSLEVLVGAKYKRATDDSPEPAHDQAYKDAVEVLQDICDDLKRNAEAHEAECDKHLNKVEAFRNTTISDKTKVDDLDFKWNSKKEKDGTTDRQCYADLINTELARIRDDEKVQLKKYKDASDEYDYDVKVATTTLTYAWFFPLGTLAAIGTATAFGVKATEAKGRMQDAEKDYAKDVDKERALMVLCNWVSHMAETVHKLDKGMDDAITAMKSIKEMFSQQKDGFSLVKTMLGDAEAKFNKDYNLRKRILGKFTSCIEEWQKIQQLAQAFLDTSSPVIAGVNSATCTGNLENLPDEAKPKEDK